MTNVSDRFPVITERDGVGVEFWASTPDQIALEEVGGILKPLYITFGQKCCQKKRKESATL